MNLVRDRHVQLAARRRRLSVLRGDAVTSVAQTAEVVEYRVILAPPEKRSTLLHRHEHHKQLTEAEREDSQNAEFTEEVANLYQPAAGSPEAQRLAEVRQAEQLRHADRIPKIQIPLSDGERVPVRYDAANRSKLVLDVPAMQRRALLDYIKREQRPKEPRAAQGAHSGPPWVVPTHCPNCGAPVDQAKASRDADPLCQFCTQPIPVTPLQAS